MNGYPKIMAYPALLAVLIAWVGITLWIFGYTDLDNYYLEIAFEMACIFTTLVVFWKVT